LGVVGERRKWRAKGDAPAQGRVGRRRREGEQLEMQNSP